jgi:protein-tyrosine-phosphatase
MEILCVCNGNAFRSQIAGAMLRQVGFSVDTCGITPCKEIHWKTKIILLNNAPDLLDYLDNPKSYVNFLEKQYDWVLFFSEESFKFSSKFTAKNKLFYCVKDPMPEGDIEEFERSFFVIAQSVFDFLVKVWEQLNVN